MIPTKILYGQTSPSAPKQNVKPDQQITTPLSDDRFGTAIQEKTNPRVVQDFLEAALSGDPEAAHRVYVRMEDTWDRLQKDTHELRTAAARQAWVVEPFRFKDDDATPEAEEKAAFVEDVIRQMRGNTPENKNGFRDMLYDLTDAVGKGLSVQEIEWQYKDSSWVPKSTRWVDPRYYGSDPHGSWLGLRNLPGNTAWQPFPDNHFITASFKNRSGNSMGYGLFRSLAWWWAIGIYSRSWMARFAELFGIPFRVAKHRPGAKPEEIAQIENALEDAGAAGFAVIPDQAQLELLESGKSATENPNHQILERRDRAADILILGQTLTTDVGESGSRALGEVHEMVRLSRLIEVADWAMDIINDQFVKSIIQLNWGNCDEAPTVKMDIPDRTDPLAKIQRDEIASRILPLPKRWLYQRHEIPEPGPDEETVMQLAPSMPGFTGSRQLGNQVFRANGGGVLAPNDQLLDKAIQDAVGVSEQWLGPIKPKIAALFAMAQREDVSEEAFGNALQALIDEVPGLFEHLNKGVLIDSISKVSGAAVVNGAVDRMLATPGSEELFTD